MVARLVDIAEMDGGPILMLPLSGCSAGDQLEQGGLAGAIGPITPTIPPGGSEKLRSSNSNVSP
jgi:hypothetical protein